MPQNYLAQEQNTAINSCTIFVQQLHATKPDFSNYYERYTCSLLGRRYSLPMYRVELACMHEPPPEMATFSKHNPS